MLGFILRHVKLNTSREDARIRYQLQKGKSNNRTFNVPKFT